MEKYILALMLSLAPFLGFSQGVKANLYDKFLKKQRVEMESLAVSGLTGKNKLSLSYSAIGSSLYLTTSGTGWGTTTIDNGDELLLLLSNDSVVTLRSASLQSFEPNTVQNVYRHQYLMSNNDLLALSKYDVTSIRKYSFKTFSDLKIPAGNAERLKKMSALFVAELKKANIFKTLRHINLKEIRNYIGDSVEFCSTVFKTRYFQESEGGPTLLDIQADFSDPFVNILIMEKDRAKFNDAPEKKYLNKEVCISGVVTLHNNIPSLVVHDNDQIKLNSPVDLAEIDLFVGDSVTVAGMVYTARYLDDTKTKPTLLNVGAPFPDQPLTLVIENEDRKNFVKPEEDYLHKTVRVSGKVVSFKGKPQIVLQNMQQIKVLADQEPKPAFSSLPEEGSVRHSAQNAAKQPLTENKQEIVSVSTYAEFPGGSDALRFYLRDNLITPEQLGSHEQKRVVASFEIGADGGCSKISIIETAGTNYDNEVRRVLQKMPKWKPATKDGVNIPITITLPITFSGNESDRQK